jgi:hypothetical protein
MKVFVVFLISSFIAGGSPRVRRLLLGRPWLAPATCVVVAASFYSLRVLL